MNVGKKVKLSRNSIENILIEKGLSFKWLGNAMGKGNTYVTDHFAPSRKGQFAISTALAMANLLDCGIEDMQGDETEPEKEIDKTGIEEELKKINITLDCLLGALYSLGDLYKQAWIDKAE